MHNYYVVTYPLNNYLGSEHMNKMFRYYRTHHARRGSLMSNLKDVFDRSAQTADPEILSKLQAKVIPMRKQRALPMSIKPLLVHPELYEFEEEATEIMPAVSDTDLSSDEEFRVGNFTDSEESDPAMSEPAKSDTSSESSDPSDMEVDSE